MKAGQREPHRPQGFVPPPPQRSDPQEHPGERRLKPPPRAQNHADTPLKPRCVFILTTRRRPLSEQRALRQGRFLTAPSPLCSRSHPPLSPQGRPASRRACAAPAVKTHCAITAGTPPPGRGRGRREEGVAPAGGTDPGGGGVNGARRGLTEPGLNGAGGQPAAASRKFGRPAGSVRAARPFHSFPSPPFPASLR